MATDNIAQIYALWREKATEDVSIGEELASIEGQDAEIRDRFYRDLAFGTGGLRGVIGAGTNRMNIYTVRKATQGLADWLAAKYDRSAVAISFDSRNKSDLFALESAKVLAANGIKAYLFDTLEPTPVLSFAVRALDCQAGIMVTASHNPAKYNGYKCYGADGCQMTDNDANAVTDRIEALDIFSDVRVMTEADAKQAGLLETVPASVLEAFYGNVLSRQVNPGICKQAGLSVIYTPLNGTGNIPVRHVLAEIGIENCRVVPQQEKPDGNFPTTPYPNPEFRQAFEGALEMAKEAPADLLLATDPDCDRVGIAVLENGDYTLMTGNEVGCMLLDYLLSSMQANGTLPQKPVAVKTIVTSDLAAAIAASYGCEMREVLTGFKYIGEQIGLLEKDGEADRYILGFEESYGYLSGSYVRDKDGVVAAMLICEMAAYYKTKGLSLTQVLQALYDKHGVYRHSLLNKAFEGEQGMNAMNALMTGYRTHRPREIAGLKVESFSDYLVGERTDCQTGAVETIDLPSSNVVSFGLEGHASVVVRPSGTEPKIKAYVTATGKDLAEAQAMTDKLLKAAEDLLS